MHEPERRPLMTAYSLEQNKRIALEAFETLFNKRDYQAAKKFWSPDYMHHSAHILPGRDGLFNLVRAAPPTLHYDNALILAQDDYEVLQCCYCGMHQSRTWLAS